MLTGGERLGNSTYAPTVLDAVSRESRLAREEAFAPLVLLMPYRTLDDAIATANATPYGLNAGIYTNDLNEALTAAREIVAGSVMINDAPTFRSDLMPYGGRKQSGLRTRRRPLRDGRDDRVEGRLLCVRDTTYQRVT